MSAPGISRVIYHLGDGSAPAGELGKLLESLGFKVEPVGSVEHFLELLSGHPPHAVLVDASHASDLAIVGAACRQAQQSAGDNSQRIALVAMAPQDNMQSRLNARRAGVDALLFPPFHAVDVARRLQSVLAPATSPSDNDSDAVRILIVEDDRSQALFAKTILINAGMQAEVEHDPLHVLEALEALHPDLVLMDLHMPDADGVELTALIREHPVFGSTPIVFLSGESDPEARFNAIDAGGDDFLAKPIRPKHLIAAVANRVRRKRLLEKSVLAQGARDEATGLYRRDFLLDRINAALAHVADAGTAEGGVLFVKINGSSAIRERLGLVALERVFSAAGRLLNDAIGDRDAVAGINDNAFLVLATDLDDGTLDTLASRLRALLMEHSFKADGKTLRLQASVGIAALRCGCDDANALFDTVERTCREARIGNLGIKRYIPPEAAEKDRQAAQVERLREAIHNGGLDLFYQPIVAVQGGNDAQFQTLVRRRAADGRLIAAAEILPIAERGNLMVELDRWALTHALGVVRQQDERWRPVRLFVPQSMTTLTTSGQAAWLAAEMARHNATGSSLTLECRLEDALLNPPALAAFATAMRKPRIRFCLTHYEQSPAADLLLASAPLGFIKLARKYAAPNASPEVRIEMTALVERAHGLGIKAIGHRVEDPQAAAALWISGIDFIQGNLVQGVGETLDFDFKAAVV